MTRMANLRSYRAPQAECQSDQSLYDAWQHTLKHSKVDHVWL